MTAEAQTQAPIPIFVSQRGLAKRLGIDAHTMRDWAKTSPLWGPDGQPGRTLRYHTGKLPLLQAVIMGTMSEAEAWALWEAQRARIGHEDVKPIPIGSTT